MNCLVSDGEQYCGKPATQTFMRIPACDECVSELQGDMLLIKPSDHGICHTYCQPDDPTCVDQFISMESKIPDPPSSQSGIYT